MAGLFDAKALINMIGPQLLNFALWWWMFHEQASFIACLRGRIKSIKADCAKGEGLKRRLNSTLGLSFDICELRLLLLLNYVESFEPFEEGPIWKAHWAVLGREEHCWQKSDTRLCTVVFACLHIFAVWCRTCNQTQGHKVWEICDTYWVLSGRESGRSLRKRRAWVSLSLKSSRTRTMECRTTLSFKRNL